MLFMVIEHFRPGRPPDVYRRFRDRGRMAPSDVRYVSSWVDLDFRGTSYRSGAEGSGLILLGYALRDRRLEEFAATITAAAAALKDAPR